MNKSKFFLLAVILIIIIASILGVYIVTSPKPVQKRPKAAEVEKPRIYFDIDPKNPKKGDIFVFIIKADPNGKPFNAFDLSFAYPINDISFPSESFEENFKNSKTVTNQPVFVERSKNNGVIRLYGTLTGEGIRFTDPGEEIARIEMKRTNDKSIIFNWESYELASPQEKFTPIADNGVFTFGEEITPPIVTPTVIVTPPEVITPTKPVVTPTKLPAPEITSCVLTIGNIDCRWGAVTDAAKYIIKVTGDPIIVDNKNTPNLAYSQTPDNTPKFGETYSAQVAAIDNQGNPGDWSEKYDILFAPVPSSFSCKISSGKIEWSWSSVNVPEVTYWLQVWDDKTPPNFPYDKSVGSALSITPAETTTPGITYTGHVSTKVGNISSPYWSKSASCKITSAGDETTLIFGVRMPNIDKTVIIPDKEVEVKVNVYNEAKSVNLTFTPKLKRENKDSDYFTGKITLDQGGQFSIYVKKENVTIGRKFDGITLTLGETTDCISSTTKCGTLQYSRAGKEKEQNDKTLLPGDTNNDDIIDLGDIAKISGYWGKINSDVNLDNTSDLGDISIVSAFWGGTSDSL